MIIMVIVFCNRSASICLLRVLIIEFGHLKAGYLLNYQFYDFILEKCFLGAS